MRVRRSYGTWLERALILVGLVCLGYYGYQTAEARNFQREQSALFESRLLPSDTLSAVPSAVAARRDVAEAASGHIGESSAPRVFALLDIPRLKLSSPIMSGDGADTLDVAIGHLPDTPKPWEPGNSALAAHRDGIFRPLRRIRVGDDIRVRTEHGEFMYKVRETKIVTPEDLSVLAPTETQSLTLITCYPFNFVGHAPKRFIVHADRVD